MSNSRMFAEEYLETKIINLRYAYWKGTPLVSDADYDKTVEELKAINPSNHLLHEIECDNTPIENAIVHKKPMLSLDKVYSKSDLINWINKVSRSSAEEFLIQPKYDGISCHLDNGIWSTRGDGKIGQNITAVCETICNIEKDKNSDEKDLYGEIVIKKSDFVNHYAKNVKSVSGNPFKNSRNAVVGIITADDISFYQKQNAKLALVDYNLYSFKVKANEIDFKWEIIKSLIENLDYPMDGIVVKIADEDYSNVLGCTAHHPRGQIAFKFSNPSAWTELEDIEYGMGKEQITATAVFKPIELGGVTISRAVIPMYSKTLPCVQKGHFSKGSKLLVERAGDVIPHIIQVEFNENASPFGLNLCPFCGSYLVQKDNKVFCPNDDCYEKRIQKIYYALTTLGIKDVGLKTIREVCNFIKGVNPINLATWMEYFVHDENKVKMLDSINGFGEITVNHLFAETKRISNTTEAKFFASLNIPNVGMSIAEKIFEKYNNIPELFHVSVDELASIPNVGNIMAQRIYDYLRQNAGNIGLLHGYFSFNQSTANGNRQTVCFTGAMRYPRSQMEKIAHDKGFVPTSSVTRNLGCLVIADAEWHNQISSKCQKARKYGIKILSESDFLSL